MLGEILSTLSRGATESAVHEVIYHSSKNRQEFPNKFPNKLPNKLPNKFPDNIRNKYPQVPEIAWQIASLISEAPGKTTSQIGKAMGVSDRTDIISHPSTFIK